IKQHFVFALHAIFVSGASNFKDHKVHPNTKQYAQTKILWSGLEMFMEKSSRPSIDGI
ncbi:unnamed protein product, partial [Urochloa humidicola]